MASRPTDRNLHIDRDRSGMAAVVIHQLRLAGFEGQYLQALMRGLIGITSGVLKTVLVAGQRKRFE